MRAWRPSSHSRQMVILTYIWAFSDCRCLQLLPHLTQTRLLPRNLRTSMTSGRSAEANRFYGTPLLKLASNSRRTLSRTGSAWNGEWSSIRDQYAKDVLRGDGANNGVAGSSLVCRCDGMHRPAKRCAVVEHGNGHCEVLGICERVFPGAAQIALRLREDMCSREYGDCYWARRAYVVHSSVAQRQYTACHYAALGSDNVLS